MSQISFSIETALGSDALSVLSFEGEESIFGDFHYRVQCSSLDPELDPSAVVGEAASLEIIRPFEGNSVISGVVSSFSHSTAASDLSMYEVIIQPWTWFLSKRANCRIFQEKSAVDILKQVFSDAGFSGKVSVETQGSYSPREFAVQYRESDYDFVHRIMAEEGIFYYFKFADGDHTLVLTDSGSSLPKIDGDEIPYLLGQREAHTEEGISLFTAAKTLTPTSVTFRDYNYLQPSTNFEVKAQSSGERPVYDNPVSYSSSSDGDKLAKIRLESLQVDGKVFYGETNSRRMASGMQFSLYEHLRDEYNDSYIVISAKRSGSQIDEEPTYLCSFEAIPAQTPFRPKQSASRPSIGGIQTAVVVGPGGEEIWTDAYGRIKIQFHWDQKGGKNEKSSCWVRVMQPIAGPNFGSLFIPRIGHEVIVQFIDGNPDRPVVTGSLYHEENKPPYDLPANATQSGIVTRSSPGGAAANANELRFEDKKGSEHILIHAEKDFMVEVENDLSTEVGANESRDVTQNRTTSIGVNESLEIGGEQQISVSGDRSVSTDGNETISVAKNRTVSVDKNLDTNVDGNNSLNIKKNDTRTVGQNEEISVKKKSEVSIGEDAKLDVGKKYTIQVKEEMMIKVGKASITLKKDGTILLDGKDIKIQASGALNAKASKDIIMKGKNVKQN